MMAGRKLSLHGGYASAGLDRLWLLHGRYFVCGGPILQPEGYMRLQGNRRGALLLLGVTLAVLIVLIVVYVLLMPR